MRSTCAGWIAACSRRAAATFGDMRGRRRAARRDQRRRRDLCRQPQHQLHQHVQLSLLVLRLLEGHPQARGRRAGLSVRHLGDRAPLARGAAPRCDRGVPAGRHPSELYRRDLSRDPALGESRGSGDARACLLAARGLAWRRDAGHALAGLSLAAASRGTRKSAGNGRRDSGRRVRDVLCPDKLRTRSGSKWSKRRTGRLADDGDHDVRSRRRLSGLGGHLLRLRELQKRTHGITEFVPLPFVAHEAPLYKRGLARPGPTLREALARARGGTPRAAPAGRKFRPLG